MPMSPRVLIISHEAPGINMSGPAIRYWHLAHTLASELIVTLAVPDRPELTSSTVRIVAYERQKGLELREYAAECDVLIGAGYWLYHYPFLRACPQPMVIDLYDPFVLENLEIHSSRTLADQVGIHKINLAVLNEQLIRGDFFICATEQQRDFWLGMLMAIGRVNPYTFGNDRLLRRLIDVVPFGIADGPPMQPSRVLKGIYPGITASDKVVFWGGGLWEWFDPLTAIQALAEIARQRSDIKLFFAGVRHPNPDVPPMRMVQQAQALSQSLGLTNCLVFFNDWIPYSQRMNYLREAQIGISLHFEHIETRFSYRTRLLDYIAAGLPMVITRGDPLGQMAEAYGLAICVAPQDIQGTAQAILTLVEKAGQPAAANNFVDRAQALAAELRWSKTVAPLIKFCHSPYHAADYGMMVKSWKSNYLLLAKAWESLRTHGVSGLVNRVRLYLNG